ncbi:acyltransferase family protein [Erwinia sp. Eh17-17]|uniref:acyltransferase family protein n=1 Tax=Erwinia sp. Eh17-17 TaxID=3080330 RepID=UPI003209D3AA
MRSIRFDWVDSLKFLGIFAIYVGHLGPGAGKIPPFVFSYHVPLFFFISGFFSKELRGISFIQFFIDKFKRLMIPYFSFCFIILLLTSLNAGDPFKVILHNINDIIYGVRNNPSVGTIWFINCMFAMIVIDGAFLKIIGNKYVILVISLCAFIASQTLLHHNPLVMPKWFWNIDSAIAYWWLMALGRCMFKFMCESTLFAKSLYGAALFSVLSFVTLYQLFNSRSLIEGLTNELFPQAMQYPAFGMINTLVTTTSLILFNVFLSKLICSSKYINEIGKNTLNICGLEVVTKTLLPLSLAALGIGLTIPNPSSAIIYALICLFISNVIGKWLSRNLGKPFKI